MYDEQFHEWKVILLHLICITFGQNFDFFSNLSCDAKLLTSFPVLKLYCFSRANFLYFIHFFWYNKDNLISNKPICFKHFSNNNLNYVTQLFCDMGNKKEWVKLKHEFNLENNLYFNWMRLTLTQYLKNRKTSLKITEYLKTFFFWTTIL